MISVTNWSFFGEISMGTIAAKEDIPCGFSVLEPDSTTEVIIFTWRLVHNFLPLDVTLRSRGLSIPSICDCCRATEETTLHLFLGGPVAKEV